MAVEIAAGERRNRTRSSATLITRWMAERERIKRWLVPGGWVAVEPLDSTSSVEASVPCVVVGEVEDSGDAGSRSEWAGEVVS